MAAATHDAGEVVNYLKEFLTQDLEMELDDFDPKKPLFDLGIDSIDVMELTVARTQARDAVASLYYRHFDFLPKPVLESLVRLQTVLDSQDRGLMSIRDDMICPMTQEEIPAFVDECSLHRNAALFSSMALTSGNPVVRHNQAVKLHARHVLFQMNRYASIDDLLQIERTMKKRR